MNWRQVFVLKTLFAIADSERSGDGYVPVLKDAPPEDVAFMNQLIKEESVLAYKPKHGHLTRCFMFRGISEKGRRVYWPIVAAEQKAAERPK